ncbi:MAG TPA: hypothetical protein VJV04_12200 [Nitrospiraceae bacterium]|nr:hypothetical protein [Nitrospiraceae bacterium]
MPILSRDELKTVIAESQRPSVSLFLPTHRAGPQIQQDPIRLKNLLKQAESQLITDGIRATEARDLLAPAAALLEDAAFWRHQDGGLAIFRSSESFRVFRLPDPVQEFVSVADRFYVKPLLPLLVNDVRFYILALSQKTVRLLECSRDRVQEVDLPGVPNSMTEALNEVEAPQLQFHSLPVGGMTATRFHGHGVGIDDVDVINLQRYFHRVNDGLEPILKNQQAPLVLACVEYLAPLYRETNPYPHVLNAIVSGNPDGLKNEELHQKAWSIVEPTFQKARARAAAQYHEGIAKGRAAHSLAEILTAAYQGRVASLFVPLGVQRWGRFNFESLSLEEHEQEQSGDDELLDLATMQTLMHGGNVYAVHPDEIPDRHVAAAVFRF